MVANEVKELAKSTWTATEDIVARVDAIQADTAAAVAAIGQIGRIIDSINVTQTTIASAVEEQTATTNEMGRNVAEAATGSGEIADNITLVARAASDATAGAAQTAAAATELSDMAAQMRPPRRTVPILTSATQLIIRRATECCRAAHPRGVLLGGDGGEAGQQAGDVGQLDPFHGRTVRPRPC